MTRVNGSRLMIAICVMAVGILFLKPPLARAGEDSSPSQVNVSPTVESAADTFAFIRWTTRNPGGTILHYAIVHYGTDPNHLDLSAMSPTRINPSHSDMVFRVRVNHLQPDTTYYYWVSSTQADGNADPVTSSVRQFNTRPTDQMSAGNQPTHVRTTGSVIVRTILALVPNSAPVPVPAAARMQAEPVGAGE